MKSSASLFAPLLAVAAIGTALAFLVPAPSAPRSQGFDYAVSPASYASMIDRDDPLAAVGSSLATEIHVVDPSAAVAAEATPWPLLLEETFEPGGSSSGSGSGGSGGSGGGGTPTWKLVGWNDIGMHWMDSDYSVFSILPPGNNVQAHLINPSGSLVQSGNGITVTYEAVADLEGSFTATSDGKTNYWQFATTLYGGSNVPETGLFGYDMPGPLNVPQVMGFDPAGDLFRADGIPITRSDQINRKRNYPLMMLVAKDATGTTLATTDITLPIGDTMDCGSCHASGQFFAPAPASGHVFDPNVERDFRLNILKLHDDRNGTGLYAQAINGAPVRCTTCHASNALPGFGGGVPGIPPLTEAIHEKHRFAVDPETFETLEASTDRSACYNCHPGQEAHFLRGAMGRVVAADGSYAINCQDCHGPMSSVGTSGREGWLDEPSCQNCHTGTATDNNGQIRYLSAFEPSGAPRQAVNQTFATNPDVPGAGQSLYRFSQGHGGLKCETCHGPPHAINPSGEFNDNLQNESLQGHAGVLSDCIACHDGNPNTVSGGPHGMHPVGQAWVGGHESAASNNVQQCKACHGTDYRGTVLSRALGDRTLNTQFGTKDFWRGFQVSCWACHDGPGGEGNSSDHPPVVANASATTSMDPVTVTLVGTDPDNDPLTFRIVSQPAHGRVALTGNQATYYPELGFAGTDTFTFAAWDGLIDSNLGTVTITRGANWRNYGEGYPGTGGAVPGLVATTPPGLGTTMQVLVENTSGSPAWALMAIGAEPGCLPTEFGGRILVHTVGPFAFVLGAQGHDFVFAVPNDPSLIGLSVYGQVAQMDPGATFGWAFSRGIQLTVGVMAQGQNLPPVAQAGANQQVQSGATVTLDGSGSFDPEGQPLTYQWTQLSGTSVTLSNPIAEAPTFTAPSGAATLVFELVVNDGTESSLPDTVQITVSAANQPPVANAGANQQVPASSTVTLDGSGSFDPEGQPLTYQWTQLSGAPVTLSSTTVVMPTFTAPGSGGTLVFQLVVSDGTLTSAPATVSITVALANLPPVANAGANQQVTAGNMVTLDGTGSFDPEGQPITFLWTQLSGTAVTLSSTTAVMPTFMAPATSDVLVFELLVNDGTFTSPPDTVEITVTAPAGTSFANEVIPIFSNRGCTGCHGGAGGLTLTGTPNQVYGEVITRVNVGNPPASLILTEPLATSAGGVGHGGGTFFQTTADPDYQTILDWILEGAQNN